MAGMKAELKHLLSQPLIARGVSARYITSGSRPIVDDLLAGECEFFSFFLSYSKFYVFDFESQRNNGGVQES